jgi:hypothetical protein
MLPVDGVGRWAENVWAWLRSGGEAQSTPNLQGSSFGEPFFAPGSHQPQAPLLTLSQRILLSRDQERR